MQLPTNSYKDHRRLLIVGAGPAGTSCAIRAAQLGMEVMILERARFPRDKVCGDCLTPRIWSYFETLGMRERVEALPSVRLKAVCFEDTKECPVEVSLPGESQAEVAVKRSLLDAALLQKAKELGVRVEEESPVETIQPRWKVTTVGGRVWGAPVLIAADGRNSTVARLAGVLPPARRDRLAVQAHIPMLAGWESRVGLLLRPEGYVGVAPVDAETLNLCLVSTKSGIQGLKRWADLRFSIPANTEWRSLAPLVRKPVEHFPPGMLGVGDVGRVVEPFTGEGITYAVASGILAAEALIAEPQWRDIAARFRCDMAMLYRGRLWVNGLSRLAVERPHLGNAVLRLGRRWPGILNLLTAKVVGHSR